MGEEQADGRVGVRLRDLVDGWHEAGDRGGVVLDDEQVRTVGRIAKTRLIPVPGIHRFARVFDDFDGQPVEAG